MRFARCQSLVRRGLFLVAAALAVFIVESDVAAEVRVVTLPSTMADFALNPKTGDIATIDAAANRAFLFPASGFGAAAPTSAGEVRVGDTPVSITYKQYQDKEYYAVVCSQDSHMYVIDAQDFTLAKKVPLASAGVSQVTSSKNPDDPFLYYNYGSGHDSAAGAVDVRAMVDRGVAFDDSMDCAISADGRIAYRRGPWSPSGFESLQMSSDFADAKPTFVRLFYDHNSTGPYVPDPFGSFTATSKFIYTKSLETQVAQLDFWPSCFFATKPVVVGISGDAFDFDRNQAPPSLRAASYNTFSSIGGLVELPPAATGEATALPRGVEGQADFKRVALKRQILADDKHERVVYAFRNAVMLVPLAEFGLPDEPFMLVNASATNLTVGTQQTIDLNVADPRVTVTIDDLPPGAEKTAKGLKWTPKSEHVGPTILPLTLRFNDIQRVVQVELDVSQPFIPLPFSPADMLINDTATLAVCWSGPATDEFGRPASFHGPGSPPTECQLAVVSMGEDPPQIKTKTLPYAVKQVAAIDQYVVVLPASESSRVEVYNTQNMEREHTLVGISPIMQVRSVDGRLQLLCESSIDTYTIPDFKRLDSVAASQINAIGIQHPALASLKDGVIVNGVLFDKQLKQPKLILTPGQFPLFAAADSRLYSGTFLRQDVVDPIGNREIHRPRPHGSTTNIVAGPTSIDSRGISVALERSITHQQVAGAVHTSRTKHEVSLAVMDASGARQSRIPIVNESFSQELGRGIQSQTPRMSIVGDTVYVLVADRLLRWSATEFPAVEQTDVSEAVEFHIVPQQSAFAVADDTTKLTHTIKGGKTPYEYFWLTRLDGVSLDEKTGEVTIDRPQLIQAATQYFVQQYAQRGDADQAAIALRSASIELIEPATRVLGRRPTGIPVAIPIHFKAIDEEGKVAEMQYFVLLETPYAAVVEKIQEKAKEIAAQRLAAQERAAQTPAISPLVDPSGRQPASDVAALEKRIELLEAKVDLLIRQLSQLAEEKENR